MGVIQGLRLAVGAANIRYHDRDDVVLIRLDKGCTTSAVFTNNTFAAAPVLVAREHLQAQQPQALLINAGNANAATGHEGIKRCRQTCQMVADALSIPVTSVLPFSTGVIGEQLPIAPFSTMIPLLASQLSESKWGRAAQAILTTDTCAKQISQTLNISEQTIHIQGMAKGSGMIQPNMATMLAYFATDIAIDQTTLDALCRQSVQESFNAITVDSDTSTNDACVLIATGKSGVAYDHLSAAEQQQFQQALWQSMQTLAQAIVRDGEGATKFITVQVSGAPSTKIAREIAFSIANSPLVKTALFASDPNWGRLAMAIGKVNASGIIADTISISFNGAQAMIAGQLNPDYSEAEGKAALSSDEIVIEVSLGAGSASITVWTSDLSYDYIKINADYRS